MNEKLKEKLAELKTNSKELLKGLAHIALKAWFIMLLWNDIANYLFDFPKVNYWQSLGLLLLVSFLFKANVSNILKELKKK